MKTGICVNRQAGLTIKRHYVNPPLYISDFDYDLPEDRIAAFPASERDLSKLLIYNGQKSITHDRFRHIVNYIQQNSLLVFNNTRVIHARLLFKNEKDDTIEIFCLKPVEPEEYETAFKKTGECTWECMVGNLRRWKSRAITKSVSMVDRQFEMKATKLVRTSDGFLIHFTWSDQAVTFGELIDKAGFIPLPPYIKRQPVEADYYRYQTVYARNEGSVAAPTAGLHFTEDIMQQLKNQHIHDTSLTLHVGAGTFLPVKSALIGEHSMHAERFTVTRETIGILLNHSFPLIAVGTTTVRTLESLYWLGIKLMNDGSSDWTLSQWEPYEIMGNAHKKESLEALYNYLVRNRFKEITASTSIMIVPGYRFRLADQMITNFHQPRSTLLLLVAAFIGSDWKMVYEYALRNDFRFLSYGDSSLLIPSSH